MRVRQSDLEAFLEAGTTARKQARKLHRYSVSIDSGEEWSCELDATSADRAAWIAMRRWRSEVGSDEVVRTLRVSLLTD